jgi:hypothetical protein
MRTPHPNPLLGRFNEEAHAASTVQDLLDVLASMGGDRPVVCVGLADTAPLPPADGAAPPPPRLRALLSDPAMSLAAAGVGLDCALMVWFADAAPVPPRAASPAGRVSHQSSPAPLPAPPLPPPIVVPASAAGVGVGAGAGAGGGAVAGAGAGMVANAAEGARAEEGAARPVEASAVSNAPPTTAAASAAADSSPPNPPQAVSDDADPPSASSVPLPAGGAAVLSPSVWSAGARASTAAPPAPEAHVPHQERAGAGVAAQAEVAAAAPPSASATAPASASAPALASASAPAPASAPETAPAASVGRVDSGGGSVDLGPPVSPVSRDASPAIDSTGVSPETPLTPAHQSVLGRALSHLAKEVHLPPGPPEAISKYSGRTLSCEAPSPRVPNS